MAIGDLSAVPDCEDVYYVDTGMYDTPAYGSVYVIDGEEPAVVDTGIGKDYPRVRAALDGVGVGRKELAYVLPTHVHLDHAGGAGLLAAEYPESTVLVHESGVDHLVDPSRLVAGTKSAVEDQWEFYADPEPVPEDRVEGLTDGDEVNLGDRTLDVVGAPGHAPHQVMFHDRRADALFVGDAAGIFVPADGEIRPTSPPSQFHLEKCLADVNTILEIEPETVCFGHFGPREFDADLIEGYKRTLVEWVEAVRRKRAELDDDEAVIEHFQAETEMADRWGERKARAEERLNVRGVLGYLDYRDAEGAVTGALDGERE